MRLKNEETYEKARPRTHRRRSARSFSLDSVSHPLRPFVRLERECIARPARRGRGSARPPVSAGSLHHHVGHPVGLSGMGGHQVERTKASRRARRRLRSSGQVSCAQFSFTLRHFAGQMSAPTSVSPGDSRSGPAKKSAPAIALSAPHHVLVVLDISRVPPMILIGALERMPPQGTYHA